MGNQKGRLIRLAVLGGFIAWWMGKRQGQKPGEGVWKDATPPHPPSSTTP